MYNTCTASRSHRQLGQEQVAHTHQEAVNTKPQSQRLGAATGAATGAASGAATVAHWLQQRQSNRNLAGAATGAAAEARRLQQEEQADLFVFNDTIEGPRAPAVEPGQSNCS
jgi:hypothetical protein